METKRLLLRLLIIAGAVLVTATVPMLLMAWNAFSDLSDPAANVDLEKERISIMMPWFTAYGIAVLVYVAAAVALTVGHLITKRPKV